VRFFFEPRDERRALFTPMIVRIRFIATCTEYSRA
jgi:hypothetical protein